MHEALHSLVNLKQLAIGPTGLTVYVGRVRICLSAFSLCLHLCDHCAT